MTGLIAAFAVVFAMPLVFGSWRLALAGLSAQALIILVMMLGGSHGQHPLAAALLVVDLGLVRALAAPLLLARAAKGAPGLGGPAIAEPELELFPGDLLHWVVAAGVVALGVWFGARLCPGDFAAAAHVATAATEVLLGFKIVAHQRTVLGQAIGMLTIENGVVLFEARLDFHWPLLIHVGLTAVFVGLVVVVIGFLRRHVDASPAPVETSAAIEVL